LTGDGPAALTGRRHIASTRASGTRRHGVRRGGRRRATQVGRDTRRLRVGSTRVSRIPGALGLRRDR
jgi:hypothetical protein